MDHLPLPKGCRQHPSVPLLRFNSTPCRYNTSPFADFPSRNGLDKLALEFTSDYTNGGKKSREEAGAFVQEWLWFGFLSAFLESDIEVDNFVCIDDNRLGPILSTKCLPYVLTDWCRQIDALIPSDRNERIERVENLFQDAKKFVWGLSYSISGERYKNTPVCPEIALSIQVLGWTLSKVCRLLKQQYKITNDKIFVWGRSMWAVNRLLGCGWCPSTIPQLTQWFPASHYYVALLGPLFVQKDHKDCSDFACKYDALDESLYEVKHVREGCNCRLRTIPPNSIATAIDENRLPLISISEGSISLTPREFEGDEKYIAISHVWSDGLGNPNVDGLKHNGLTECQVSRLYRFCKKLLPDRPVLLWMDTLCIPAQDQYRSQRKKAIATMRSIYTKAAKVLVLDAELLEACVHASNLELLLRILSSGWMRRVWTLQEGILNEATYIQFKDGVVNPVQLEGWNRHDICFGPRGERQFMFDEIDMFWSRMRAGLRLPKPQNLNQVYRAFQFRRTTHPTDETICLAILMGLDTKPLTDILGDPGTEKEIADRRMREFLRMYGTVSLDLLFLDTERFDLDGYRWAPKSFIRRRAQETSSLSTFSPTAEFLTAQNNHVERTGLYCSIAGFILEMPKLGNGERVHHTFWFYCAVTKVWYIVSNVEDYETAVQRRSINGLRNPAIIVRSRLGIGALVDIINDGEMKVAKYITHLGIDRASPELVAKTNPTMQSEGRFFPKVDDNAHLILHGKWVGKEEKWCIF